MPRNTTLPVPLETWTELTGGDATVVSFQNKGSMPIVVIATVDGTAPVAVDGYSYGAGDGEFSMVLADAFPGLTSPVRLWAYSEWSSSVFVSHV